MGRVGLGRGKAGCRTALLISAARIRTFTRLTTSEPAGRPALPCRRYGAMRRAALRELKPDEGCSKRTETGRGMVVGTLLSEELRALLRRTVIEREG